MSYICILHACICRPCVIFYQRMKNIHCSAWCVKIQLFFFFLILMPIVFALFSGNWDFSFNMVLKPSWKKVVVLKMTFVNWSAQSLGLFFCRLSQNASIFSIPSIYKLVELCIPFTEQYCLYIYSYKAVTYNKP